MMPSRWLLVGIAVVALAGVPRVAAACSCMPSGPPCQGTFTADAVFAGTVRNVTPIDDGEPLPPGLFRIPQELRVEFDGVTALRGAAETTMTVSTAGSGAGCGYDFKKGHRYLVYAHRHPDTGTLMVSLCSRTRPLAEAAEDIGFLQALAAGTAAPTRVYGTVRHSERPVGAPQGTDYGPVPDVHIVVRGKGRVYDVTTDSEGRYEVVATPGEYEVSVISPAGFSTKYLQRTITLSGAGACHETDFSIRFDGRIQGTVTLASGQPALGAVVELMSADGASPSGWPESLRATSDGAGGFEFTELSPGRYIVGVDLTRRMDPEVVFPATYHPGTNHRAEASVVELGGGEQRVLPPMMLPEPRRQRRLVGVVVFANGTPVPGASVALSDEARRQVGVGIRAESDGTVSFTVHEGLTYVVNASYRDEATGQSASIRTAPFVVTGAQEPLMIVLPRLQ